MRLLTNRVYFWEDENVIYAAMKVRVKTVNSIFGCAFEISTPEHIINKLKDKGKDVEDIDLRQMDRKRAVTQVRILLSNVYNAISVHGKKIMDNDGNIDVEKYKKFEEKIKKETKDIGDTNLSHPFKPLKDFKIIEIDLNQAKDLKLI